jgi:hypothetical protein
MISIPKENTNQCYKIINGEKTYKIKLKTDVEAINEAKRLNLKPNMIHKVIAYKCSICGYYHVGKSFKIIERKENIYKNYGV